MTVVITGYMDASNSVFCSACWPERVEAGQRANQVLTDPDDNFWIVDNCAGCGSEVKYMTGLVLD